MYTRNRQNQGYSNSRNPNNPPMSGSFTMSSYNTQGSYQTSQSASGQQSNYKQGNVQQNLQGFKSQQQQQPTQMPTTAPPTRSLPQMLPQITPQQQLQQGQQQMSQLQHQQQQTPPSPSQQTQQQQQQPTNPSPVPQLRLKPILKQSTATSSQSPVAQSTPVTSPSCAPPPPSIATPNSANNNSEMEDDDMKSENTSVEMQEQPRWRRKIPGFKVNKKLKRLRMNQRLRKTLQPKNAIMVLNEMKAGCQFTFPETQGPMTNSLYLVHAELDGKTYVGQGLSKPLARQNAAENALKALLLEKMTAASMKARIDAESDGQTNPPLDGIKEENNDDSISIESASAEDEIPWSSLASFALYKLFLEWHNQGTSVPVPRPGLPATKGAKKDNPNAPKAPAQKELPPNPTNIHPVMLLNQMRPGLTYVEINRIGNPPNTMFTLAVEVDGIEYSGTAKNKKDAKKGAAKSALLALYNLAYPEDTSKTESMITD